MNASRFHRCVWKQLEWKQTWMVCERKRFIRAFVVKCETSNIQRAASVSWMKPQKIIFNKNSACWATLRQLKESRDAHRDVFNVAFRCWSSLHFHFWTPSNAFQQGPERSKMADQRAEPVPLLYQKTCFLVHLGFWTPHQFNKDNCQLFHRRKRSAHDRLVSNQRFIGEYWFKIRTYHQHLRSVSASEDEWCVSLLLGNNMAPSNQEQSTSELEVWSVVCHVSSWSDISMLTS